MPSQRTGKRHSHSSITRLEPAIQTEVSRLVQEGWTIDDIRAELAKLGADVSRSAVGRHVKHARDSMRVYSQAQEVSKVWLQRLDAEPNGDVARLLPEMLRALAFTTIDNMQQRVETQADAVAPMDVMLLSKAIQHLSGASKDNFAMAMARSKIRAQVAAELKTEQAAKLDAVAKAKGVTDETRAAIRDALGIAA